MQRVDWVILICYLLVVLMGWMSIYSAAFDEQSASIFSYNMEYGKQFFWMMVCLLVGLFVLNIDGEFFNKFAWPIYGFVVLLLILVLIIGKEVNGAKAWFGVGSFGIQPSEFAKMATSLALAKFISDQNVKFSQIGGKIRAFAILAIPAGLIMLQPDAGTLLVFMAFIFAMYREGLSGNILFFGLGSIVVSVFSIKMGASEFDYPFLGWLSGIYYVEILICSLAILSFVLIRSMVLPRYRKRYYVYTVIVAILAVVMSFLSSYAVNNLMKEHQRERIYILLDIEVTRAGATYNLTNSKMAIGSGGFWGKGYLNGPMTKYHYVPEQSTDFIFCTVGEEWGFVGSSIVVLLFTILILRLIFLAERQRSQFSRIYGYCVASILFMHLFINVGMVMGLAPVIGIPLPFFSYGGSSLLGFTLLLFIMLRLDSERLAVLR